MAKALRIGFVVVLGALYSLVIAKPAEGQFDPCSTKAAGFSGACTAEAKTYGFTMKQFRLKRTSPAGFFTVGEGDQPFDAGSDAGVSAGQEMGKYISNKALETTAQLGVLEVEYTAVSPVLSTTWTVRGSTTVPGPCFTTVAGFSTTEPATIAAGTKSFTITSLFGSPAGVTLDTVAKTITIEDSSITGLPLKIGKDELPVTKVTVSFDPSNGVVFTFITVLVNGLVTSVCTGADFGPLGVTMQITK
jgi:hypothetical protein